MVLETETIAEKSNAANNMCRLCLRKDELLSDIFEQELGGTSKTPPLSERLFDFFQIKYERSALPNSICPHCLSMVETFTNFRQNVKRCELELRKRFLGEPILSLTFSNEIGESRRSGLNGCPGVFEPEEGCLITVIDPLQEYESSDEDFSMESDSDIEEPHSPQEQRPQPTTIPQLNITESQVKHSGDLKPMDKSNHSESITYSGHALESLAMEFTKNTFLCQFCDMAFTSHQECAEHEIGHDYANPFNCNFCSFNISSRQNLIHHIRENHDNERPYICALCSKGFCRRSDLKKHTIVHTGVRPFTCPVCAKSFSRNTNLTKHMRIHSGVKPHICQKCPRSFSTSAELMQHARSHAKVKPFQCTKCSASFTRKDKLTLHEQTHLRKDTECLINQNKEALKMIQNQSQTESIVVNLNPYEDINSQADVNYSHPHDSLQKKLHYSPRIFNQYPASGTDDSNKHNPLSTKLQDNKPPNKAAATLSTEKVKAVPRSTNSRIFTCEICSKTFTRECDLQRHQALHLDKLFNCKQCGCSFSRREKLMRHVQEHHNTQNTCNRCYMTFSKREALNMHMKVHDLHPKRHSEDESKATGSDMLQKRLYQQTKPLTDASFYSQMLPTMNLGFYNEVRSEDKNDT